MPNITMKQGLKIIASSICHEFHLLHIRTKKLKTFARLVYYY
jgi:hypothetical protein